ncbi:MAG: hypothetical protein H6739_04185 [Alphaproteobacteria bacterium]|nr:hypothetical protein [Alphaproteobacteria bacterium]
MSLLLLLAACADTTVLSDGNNYSFSSTLEADTHTVAARTDLPVDWSGLEIDLQGREVDTLADVDVLTIVILRLDKPDALDAFVNDALLQGDIVSYATCNPPDGVDSVMLSDFDFIGNPVVPEEHILPDQGTWLLSAATLGRPGALMLNFFDPVDDGPQDPITLATDSADLAYTVDISAGEPVELEGDRLEWGDLTSDMRGLPIRLSEIDRVTLARFDDTEDEIEDGFLQVDALAEQIWTADIQASVSLELSALTDESGAPFGGLSGEGIWLLALQCTTCANPAPPFLAMLR